MRGITRLALSFLRSNRSRNAVLGLAIAGAVAGGVLLVSAGEAVTRRLHLDSEQRYGTARITFPPSGASSPGGTLAGAGGWIDSEQAARIEELLGAEHMTLSARVQSEAVLASEGEFTAVTVNSDNDNTFWRLAAGSDLGIATGVPADAPLLLLGFTGLRRDAGGPDSGFINLNEAGVRWFGDPQQSDLVHVGTESLLRALRQSGVTPEGAVGNVLVIDSELRVEGADARNPAAVAYDAAELLAAEFPQAEVRSRLDLAGRGRETSAENISLLIRIALVLPAIAAIVGSVLVTAESRGEEVTLLRTMGFGVPEIRALFVREVFVVAGGATVAAFAIAFAIAALIPDLSISGRSVVRFMLLGWFVPPGMAFLTARRFLSDRLGDRLAEFRR